MWILFFNCLSRCKLFHRLSVHTIHCPASIIWIAPRHRHNNSPDFVQNLNLKCLQLPATGVKQFQPSHFPPTHRHTYTHSKSGATGFTSHRASGLESLERVQWKRSPTNMPIRLTALSQEISQHRIGLVSETHQWHMYNVQLNHRASCTSSYWLKYIWFGLVKHAFKFPIQLDTIVIIFRCILFIWVWLCNIQKESL